MVKLMEFFLRGPAEAGEAERLLKDPPGSSDKEGELRSVLDGLSFPISVPHKLVCIFCFSIFLSFCCMEMFIYVAKGPLADLVRGTQRHSSGPGFDSSWERISG